jgi:ribonuclease HI
MKQARHLLRFIKTTKVVCLTYSTQEPEEVVAFADADHAGSWAENPHSISGYVALMFGVALAWKSRKQRVISTSTAEAEVVALSDAARELWSLVEVLKGLELVSTPVKLFTDNQAAHRSATTDGPQRNKALTLRAASVKDFVKKGEIAVDWISGALQRADGLTKVLTAQAHKLFRTSNGVISLEELRRR